MSTRVQWRRGSTAQTATFTGASGEITVDTDKNVVVVHDNITPGGHAAPQLSFVQDAYNIANSAYNAANSAGSTATVTNAYNVANGAFDKANSANVLAQSAYDSSNSVGTLTHSAYDYANTIGTFSQAGYNKANSAYDAANSANTVAFSAYDKANTAYTNAGSAYNYATDVDTKASAAFNKANSANVLAQSAYNSSNTKFSSSGGTISGNVDITGQANVSQRLSVGTGSYTVLPNLISQFTGNSDYYSQINQQNLSGNGSGDIVVTADNGTDEINFIDLGITGSTYDDTTPNAFPTSKPNDGYLYLIGNPAANFGGNLVIGTAGSGSHADISFVQGTGYDESARLVYGQGLVIETGTVSSSNASGALVVEGGVGVQGAVYADALYDNGVRITVGASNAFDKANGAFDKANAANVLAQSAYDSGNSTLTYATAGFDKANAANVLAQSAYDSGNSTNTLTVSSYNKANAANVLAQSAYDSGNNTMTYATAGFNKANAANVLAQSAYDSGNNTLTYSTSGFNKANAANVLAQSAYDFGNTVNTYTFSAYSHSNNTLTYSTAGFDKANAANVLAQSAYDSGNNTLTYATSGFNKANAANVLAQSAYDSGNSTLTYATAGFDKANAANVLAQSSYDKGNTTLTYATAAFDKTNSSYDFANSVNTYAFSAYASSNTKATVYNTSSAPTSAQVDDIWIDPNSGIEYVNISSNSAVQWVEFGSLGTPQNVTANLQFADQTIFSTVGNRDITILSSGTGNILMTAPSVNFSGNIIANMSAGTATFNNIGAAYFRVNTATIQANSAAINIVASTGYFTQPPTSNGYMMQITGLDDTTSRVVNDSASSDGSAYSLFVGRKARGSHHYPSAVQSGDILAKFSGNGYGTTGYGVNAGGASIDIIATENYTDTARGTKLNISITNIGSNVRTTAATFASNNITLTGNVIANSSITSTSYFSNIKIDNGVIYPVKTVTANTTQYVDYANGSLQLIDVTGTTTIVHQNITPGRNYLIIAHNNTGSDQTINLGVLSLNCTATRDKNGKYNAPANSIPIFAGTSASYQFLTFGTDLANTYCVITPT